MKHIVIPITVLVLVAISVIVILERKNPITSTLVPVQVQPKEISITEVGIDKENYSGSRPEIKGEGRLADVTREYITKEIGAFEISANEEVPDMKKTFGANSPSASYTIEIQATLRKGEQYDSIVLNQYVYTGGANGMSSFIVFTVSNKTGEIVTLRDSIDPIKQKAFMDFVRQKLFTYNGGDETTGTTVFKEEVKNLTVEMLEDWSFDSTHLSIYFDKYDVAPGATGAFELRIPKKEIEKYLK